MTKQGDNTFSALLKQHRGKAGLTQEVLAERSALSPQAIGRLERGDRRRPRPETIAALSGALDLTQAEDDEFRQAATGDGRTIPQQLPLDARTLVGRAELHKEAVGLLTPEPEVLAPGAICLFGSAGVGKSTSALRIAHLVRDSYPDGQIFLRLQLPDGSPVDPASALATLLRSVGVPAARHPPSLDARAALFRTTVADQGILFVFDDALSLAQLKPLIPAGRGCGVIVTSRKPLYGFDLGRHREVTSLTLEESAELLTALSGSRWSEIGPGTAAAIIRHSDGSPLALQIVGSRIAQGGVAAADAIATAFADDATRLDPLADQNRALRTSLRHSLDATDPQTRLLFGRLALLPSDEFFEWVAAPLLDGDEQRGRRSLDALLDLRLIKLQTFRPAPRYRMHSVVRAYAKELTAELPRATADAARERYLRACLRLSSIADLGIQHGLLVNEGLAVPDGPELPEAESLVADHPVAWMEYEADTLCAAVAVAVDHGLLDLAGGIALRVNGFLAVRDDHLARLQVLQTARAALTTDGSPDLLARIDQVVLAASTRRGTPSAELVQLAQRARASAARAGSAELELSALRQLAFALDQMCEFEEALECYRRGLLITELQPELQDQRAMMLCGIGNVLHDLGDTEQAVTVLREAAALHTAQNRARAITLYDFAEALIDAGATKEGAEVVEEMREISTTIGDSFGLGFAHKCAARLAVRAGDTLGARRLIDLATAVFTERDAFGSLRLVGLVEAELDAARSRPDLARRRLEQTLAEATAADDPNCAHWCRRRLDELGRAGNS